MPFTPHPVFPSPPGDQRLWRFMDFPRFFYLMSRRRLFFSSLATLTNDPWEGLPPRSNFDPQREVQVGTVEVDSAGILHPKQARDVQTMTQSQFHGGLDRFSANVSSVVKGLRDLKKTIFVSCWHMNDTESEALWRIYGGPGYGICIRTTYERLGAAITADRPIYAGTVTYLDETRESLGDGNLFHNCLWKRKSFEHEREFRVVIQDSNAKSTGMSLVVDISQLVDRIIVHPEAEDWFLDIVKEFVTTCQCTASVERSSLLTPPAY
jgi:hypothetical protein